MKFASTWSRAFRWFRKSEQAGKPVYSAATHKGVKLDQDRAGHSEGNGRFKLILCDGIGGLDDSGAAAELVVREYMKGVSRSGRKLVEGLVNKADVRALPKGGTTLLAAYGGEKALITIDHLGNGGAIHLHGDYAELGVSGAPYMYAQLILPHIAPDDSLTRHLSHEGGKKERRVSRVAVELNYHRGDIVILFTDGIASLERNVVIQDDSGRYWRHESDNIQYILDRLDDFLSTSHRESFQQDLEAFLADVLNELHKREMLEDDASLGIIMTEQVLDYLERP
jgi:hypothetical protein